MNNLQTLQSLGFAWPTPTYLIGMFFFSIVGWAAYRHGKRNAHPRVRWLGIALMFFPYLVSRTWLLYLTGALLCAALFL